MVVKYDKYGMQYGWLGKRAMMKVNNEMLSPESYDEFIEYCLGYQADFEKIAMKRPKPKAIKQEKPEEIEVQPEVVAELWGLDLYQQCKNLFGITVLQFVDHLPVAVS